MREGYPAQSIEAKWQSRWAESGAHRPDMDNPRRKLYSLTMFSYPSGDKLHVGHWYNYGPADSWTRFKRMQGYTTYHPQGFDAFGLPAENYAISHNIHPAKSTKANIATMKRQLSRIGTMYDWQSYLDTSAPEYYRWTQWLFLKLFKKGLAVQEEAPVNWCPKDETVLANEQVRDGRCDRCGTQVIQKNLTQWFFRITEYAEELLAGLESLDWPEKTKTMQRNWIGRSEGAHIDFSLADAEGGPIRVFTTRPDTLYGATYMVLAPEHPLVNAITTPDQAKAVTAYQQKTNAQTELERIAQGQQKTGVFTGGYAINPATEGQIPVWIADYVLYSYGTGAIMAVPGGDERDFEFATQFGLDIIEVVSPDGQPRGIAEAYTGAGIALNSGPYNGQTTAEVTQGICDFLEQRGLGKRTIQYRLRDWCISRQRYWGAPIPIIHCPQCGVVAVPDEQLPVQLPMDIDLAAAVGQEVAPLATVPEFVNTHCPDCGAKARRDTDTMDTFVDSAWYFLRYPDTDNTEAAFSPARIKTWQPVDMYIGGIEHATMHLLYARFFVKALRDIGLLDFAEPFLILRHQGVITHQGARMSKSHGNVVSPDPFVEKYGADVFRAYLMFIGPYTEGGEWNSDGMTGLVRFQERLWRLLQMPTGTEQEPDEALQRQLHRTIRDVGADLEQLRFNTAIAHLMSLISAIAGRKTLSAEVRDAMTQMVAPIMPHLAEELWELSGHSKSIFDSGWPDFDPALCEEDLVTVGITVNGKRRGELQVQRDIARDDLLTQAKELSAVQKHLAGKEIVREVVVPGRVVNFAVR